MAWVITEADDYIRLNTVDNEDWFDTKDERKTALLNVASRTLTAKFPEVETMPDEAVYEFASVLAFVYNDTNKLAQQGQASVSIDGMSVTFKDWSKKQTADFIPDSVYEILGAPRRKVKRTVM